MEIIVIFICSIILIALYTFHIQKREQDEEGIPILGEFFDTIANLIDNFELTEVSSNLSDNSLHEKVKLNFLNYGVFYLLLFFNI